MFEEDSKAFLERVLPLLENLQADTQPGWGQMTPQHMIEHLGSVAYISSRELNIPVSTPAEVLPRSLQWLWSEKTFRKGTKAPALEEKNLGKLRYENLEQAIAKFQRAMQGFFAFFAEDPEQTLNHPVFGPLNYEGWLKFHHKHVLHHFTQFGLLEPSGSYLE